jgi:colanic acid biosynthesis glycosyl transferase WcaI
VPLQITICTSLFPPESAAAAKRASALAGYLASHGWRVVVITHAPNYPQGVIHHGFGARAIDRRIEDGIEVVRMRPWIVDKRRLGKRTLSELWTAIRASGLTVGSRPDVILATSPSMFLGQAAWLCSRLLRVPFVWEVRDLTWRYARATGKATFGLDHALEAIMLWTARRASALVTTTRGQRDYFRERGGAPVRTLVAPNGISEEMFADYERAEPAAKPPGEFRVVYAGLIGFPQGLDVMLGAAERCPAVTFHLVGDGGEAAQLRRKAEELRLSNMRFAGYVGMREVLAYYRSADVLFAQLRRDPIFAITQPSKIFEYMMAGKAIVYGGEGEAAEAVRASDAGLVVPPDDPEQLALAVERLRTEPLLAERLGDNGRRHARAHLRRETVLARVDDLLRQL